MITNHQCGMISRREVIKGWWRGGKERQESDTGQ